MRLGDVQFYDTDENVCTVETAAMVVIVLRGSKNNQYGRTDIRYRFKMGGYSALTGVSTSMDTQGG